MKSTVRAYVLALIPLLVGCDPAADTTLDGSSGSSGPAEDPPAGDAEVDLAIGPPAGIAMQHSRQACMDGCCDAVFNWKTDHPGCEQQELAECQPACLAMPKLPENAACMYGCCQGNDQHIDYCANFQPNAEICQNYCAHRAETQSSAQVAP